MIKICQRCGNEFDALSNRALRCSACRKLHKKEYNHQRYLANPEKCKAYSKNRYATHREEFIAYFRTYYKAHRAQLLQKNKQWRIDHPDYSKQWKAENPDKMRIYRQRYIDKKRLDVIAVRLEFKKARLRAKLQTAAAKRQAEQFKHKQLYQTTSDWDKRVQSSSLLSRLI